jgi:hypothetical protein
VTRTSSEVGIEDDLSLIFCENPTSADLARMWKLLYRVDGLTPLRGTFQDHVTKAGLSAVARATQGTVGADGKQENMVRCQDVITMRSNTGAQCPQFFRFAGPKILRFSAIGGI